MRKGLDTPNATPPQPKVPLPCPSRWSNGGRGSRQLWEARDMAPTSKDFFEVGDLRMPLNATLDRRGDEDDGRLEPHELREALRE